MDLTLTELALLKSTPTAERHALYPTSRLSIVAKARFLLGSKDDERPYLIALDQLHARKLVEKARGMLRRTFEGDLALRSEVEKLERVVGSLNSPWT